MSAIEGIDQQPHVARRRRRRRRLVQGLAGLGLMLAAMVAVVLSSAGPASPGDRPRNLSGVLHTIGEAMERVQARWNPMAHRPDRREDDKPASVPLPSVTLDPPLPPGPRPAEKPSPQPGAADSVATMAGLEAAAVSVPSVALDPPLNQTDLDAGLSPSGSPIAGVERPDRVDLPPSEPSVAEVSNEAAPPTPRASPPTTSSPPVPGATGPSVGAGVINAPEAHGRDKDRKEPERRERNDREGKGERVVKIERADKVERWEKVERADRPERINRPERVERAERPEKVERAERREKVEKPERGRR